MKRVVVNPEYVGIKDFVESLPEKFSSSGTTIYDSRNVIKLIDSARSTIVVKRYKKSNVFRGIGYLISQTKAERAYFNALAFIDRGIDTPAPIAYIEIKQFGLPRYSYFLSMPDFTPDLVSLLRHRDFDASLAKQLGVFVAYMHQNGVLHGDLNLSNILYDKDTGFKLIDTNRARIVASPSREKCIDDLRRVTHRRDLLKVVTRAYAEARGWNVDETLHSIFKSLLRFEKRKRVLHKIFGK
jgi:tRNA A-37 threonylcarbamoyl transferase component Bud32